MFALRKITGNGSELNFDLGDYYVLITKERSQKNLKIKWKTILVMMRLMLLFAGKMEYYHYIKNNKTILFLEMEQLIVT